MKVIHFSLTPLAGSPIRIVNALRNYTNISARLVIHDPNAYNERIYENDLIWHTHIEKALSFLEEANIIHLHHYIDLKHNPFHIDFTEYQRKGKSIIRQFHTEPLTIAGGDKERSVKIVNDPLPQLVIAQFHERFYPRARLVPNIIPIYDELYRVINETSNTIAIFFSPSVTHTAWQSRWNTKGFPETCHLLKHIQKLNPNVRLIVRHDIPHLQCLQERQLSSVSIDELITGSYHLSSLEGLSQGVPTFAYLDNRTLSVIAEITGTNEHPWLNFRLEDAHLPLTMIISDHQLRRELSIYSRDWMENYWDDSKMIQHYVNAYNDLQKHPECFSKNRFNINNKMVFWLTRQTHDLVWSARKDRYVPIHHERMFRYMVFFYKFFDKFIAFLNKIAFRDRQ